MKKAKILSSGYYAVTGTYHGSLINAETEGDARRIFHRYYKGESIISVKKRSVPAWCS